MSDLRELLAVDKGEEEEARHRRALSLSPDAPDAVRQLIALLGDPSWRVRKAALSSFERFRGRAEMAIPLVEALADPENAGLRSAAAAALSRMGELAVPQLVQALKTLDADQRKFVVEVLGESNSPEARRSLLGALDDPDDNVRSSVADALGRLGGDEIVSVLVERLRLRPEDVQHAAYALDALTRLSARLEVSTLTEFLAKRGLERLVIPLLGLSGDRAAIPLLVRPLATGTRGSRTAAVKALGRLLQLLDGPAEVELREALTHTPQATGHLQEALADADDELAESAVRLLGVLAAPHLAPMILSAAATRSFVEAATAAVMKAGRDAVPFLLEGLDGAEPDAQALFVEVVETLGDASAVPKLLALADGEGRTAEATIRALGRLGGPESLAPLIGVIERDDPELANTAAQSLAAIGRRHPDAVAVRVREALQEGAVQPAWIVILGALGREDDVDLLVAASRHRDAEVRRAAVEAFLSFHSRIDDETVVLSLTDENPSVRAAAARVLGSYRSERAVEALLVAARDPELCVVGEALKSLGSVGNAKALSTLHAAVASRSAPIVIAALEGLARLHPAELGPALRQAFAHADPEVVCEAVRVSALLPPAEALPLLTDCLGHRSWHVRLAALEMAGRRNIALEPSVLSARLDEEAEPLVREALMRLLRRAG